ncbi:MAG: STAS domain-containing protein [Terriglobales bacterium]
MTTGKAVVVKQLPERVGTQQAQALFRELQPALETDRPRLVFDFTGVRSFDSAGVELLLRCMEEAMKRNGDLKLAALSPQMAVILEMTRVDRLFEIFDNCNAAVESFHRFSPAAMQPVAPSFKTVAIHRAEGDD